MPHIELTHQPGVSFTEIVVRHLFIMKREIALFIFDDYTCLDQSSRSNGLQVIIST